MSITIKKKDGQASHPYKKKTLTLLKIYKILNAQKTSSDEKEQNTKINPQLLKIG